MKKLVLILLSVLALVACTPIDSNSKETIVLKDLEDAEGIAALADLGRTLGLGAVDASESTIASGNVELVEGCNTFRYSGTEDSATATLSMRGCKEAGLTMNGELRIAWNMSSFTMNGSVTATAYEPEIDETITVTLDIKNVAVSIDGNNIASTTIDMIIDISSDSAEGTFTVATTSPITVDRESLFEVASSGSLRLTDSKGNTVTATYLNGDITVTQ